MDKARLLNRPGSLATVCYRASAVVVLALVSTQAAGYVGPGAGLSLVGAVWGLVVAIVAALGFIVLWPVRRHWKRRRAGRSSRAEREPEMDAAGADTVVADAMAPAGVQVTPASDEPGRAAGGRIS